MTAGCGKPFIVQPKPGKGEGGYSNRTERAGVTVEAAALTDEDALYDTFEANVILAGLLPVRAKITNSGTETIAVSKASFEVQVGGKQRFKAVRASKAYDRLISFYGISIYTKRGYNQSKEDFSAYALDVKKSLAAGESREGLLFVLVPDDLIRGGDLILITKKLEAGSSKDKTPIEIELK